VYPAYLNPFVAPFDLGLGSNRRGQNQRSLRLRGSPRRRGKRPLDNDRLSDGRRRGLILVVAGKWLDEGLN
jgi:hypothetical protein